MTERTRRSRSLRRLDSQLGRDLETALRLGEQALFFAKKIVEPEIGRENPNIYAVALSLQHFYTAVESAFERVVQELDGGVPKGENWHRQLIDEVTLDIPEVRPPLISQELKDQLDRLRRFRHIVRHGYEYELDWHQMHPIIETVPGIQCQLQTDFDCFSAFLRTLATAVEAE